MTGRTDCPQALWEQAATQGAELLQTAEPEQNITEVKRLTKYIRIHHVKHANLCEAVLQRAGGLTGGVSGEADFLALFEGPSRDSVQVTVADTTAETEGRRIIMSDMHTETGSTESERVSHRHTCPLHPRRRWA